MPNSYVAAWDEAGMAVSAAGTILNLLLISSILAPRTSSTPTSLSDLLLAVLLLAKHTAIFFLLSGCKVESALLMSIVYTSVFTLSSIAAYNYAIIVPDKRPNLPRKTMILWSIALWILGIITGLLPAVFGVNFVRHTTASFCTTDPSNSSQQPYKIKIVFDIIVFSACLGVINHSYTQILLKFMRVSKRMEAVGMRNSNAGSHARSGSAKQISSQPSAHGRSSSAPIASGGQSSETSSQMAPGEASERKMAKNPQMFRIKMSIIKRALIITFGFLSCWTAFFICTLYQQFSSRYTSAEVYARALFILLRLPESWYPQAYTVSTQSASGSQSAPPNQQKQQQAASAGGLRPKASSEYDYSSEDVLADEKGVGAANPITIDP
ncbi:hypothetical protein BC831DRAFT_442422 [Entophlyctis helioformis]|nr:hypothetical protein BC831DRAFT_442422 [Entophlyctis helioformis]